MARLRPERAAALLLIAAFSGCASARKTTPELSRLEGKKVALVDVDATGTARTVVEVALVNQLQARGTFELVSRKEVETARAAPEQSPTDWKGIARRAGADYALRARVLEFDAVEREGYSEAEVEDSQLAAERGPEDAKAKRLYKVKSLAARVRVDLEFTELASDETRAAVAEHEESVSSGTQDTAARLPPRLGFLEKAANEAFRRFFERYN